MIGMARQLLADPDWVRKVEEHRPEKIIRCIYCNVCKQLDENFKLVSCFLWPKGAVQAPHEDRTGAAPHWGDAGAECRCLPETVERYRGRLSGPLLDRINLRVHVPRVPYERLREQSRESSAIVRARVIAARERMRTRFGVSSRGNADLTVSELGRFCRIDPETEELLAEAVRGRRLSVRGYHRVLRVARTIADLAGNDDLRSEDVALALLLRSDP